MSACRRVRLCVCVCVRVCASLWLLDARSLRTPLRQALFDLLARTTADGPVCVLDTATSTRLSTLYEVEVESLEEALSVIRARYSPLHPSHTFLTVTVTAFDATRRVCAV